MKRNVRMLYLMTFFHALIPAYVIERLFWQERGMSVQMVVYTEIIFAVTIMVLEIPSGILADLLGRKKLLLIGAISSCLEFAILSFSTSFWHFALAIFLVGVGSAASSGTQNALLYETLKANDEQSWFESILGRIKSLGFIATMAAALLGSLLAGFFGYSLNYWISIGSAIVSLCFAFALVEPPRILLEDEKEPSSLSCLKDAFAFFRKNPQVCFVVASSLVMVTCAYYHDEFWQIYFGEIGTPIFLFGVLSAILTLVRIPGALLSSILIKRFGAQTLLFLCILLAALGFLLAALLPGPWGLAGMLLACLGESLSGPAVSGYLHHRAPSSARATIESFNSLGERIVSIALGIAFGYIATAHSIFAGYFLLFAILAILTLLFGFVMTKFRQI